MDRATTIQHLLGGTRIELENTELGHNKFWKAVTVAEAVGARLTCTWGPRGGTPQSKAWHFATLAAAQAYAVRKADEKLQRGYHLVSLT
jgi:predicted DNA-binding WGR domain protein